MFHITISATLSDRIYPIKCTYTNVLALKVYCGPGKFYGRSKIGQFDKETNRAPLHLTFFVRGYFNVLVLKVRRIIPLISY